MKKVFYCLFIIPALLQAQTTHKKITALFLGNSYTFVNNLPQLIYNIALANGDTLIFDVNAIGGYSFNNHFTDATSLSKINAAPWKFVILQGQSQEPAFPPGQVNTQTMPYAIKLDSAIKQNYSCSNTVFYETWGRKNGDTPNCGFYPPLCTYSGMQDRLRQSYKKFADTTNSTMAPAGEAFRKSISLNPALELYDPDQSHPSLGGSFLVASVFYELLFQKSVLTNTYNPGIAANTLTFLQQVAHNTLNDSLYTWNLGKNMPWADFGFNPLTATGYQFQSATSNMLTSWYFGDGTTSGSLNPVHYYTNPGTYTVSHVVSDNCNKDSVSKVVTIVSTGVKQNSNLIEDFSVFPNPCNTALFIKGVERFKNNGSIIEIRNTLGQLLEKSEFNEVINTEQLNKGHYFIRIYNKQGVANSHFVKSE